MKKLIHSLLTLSILFTIGCEDEESDPLVSGYNIVQKKRTRNAQQCSQCYTRNADSNNTLVFTLSGNGSYTMQGLDNGNFVDRNGTWNADGNKLTLIDSDEEEGTSIMDYTLSNDILDMSYDDEYDEFIDTYRYIWEKK